MVSSMLPLAVVAALAGQARSPEELVGLLRQGGYVLVMRHASSPREAPTREQVNPDNLKLERQLDESGRRSAVLTSPTYRAMETVKLARLEQPMAVGELGDGGQRMQGVSEAQASWRSGVADGETVVLRPDGHGGVVVVGQIPIGAWSRLR